MENFLNSKIKKLFRSEKYMIDLYDIREGILYHINQIEINFTNSKKHFGYTKNSSQSVIITEQGIIKLDEEVSNRIEFLIKLIDTDFILVENIWLENKDKSISIQK